MALHTRVPDVVDALLALMKAQPEIDEGMVIDGAVSLNDYENYVIFVGYRLGTEEWISVERGSRGLRPNDQEIVTLGVMIAATDPDHDMHLARGVVAEKLGALERIVTDDPNIGLGNGVTAGIASMSWQPLHTDKGAECNVAVELAIKVVL